MTVETTILPSKTILVELPTATPLPSPTPADLTGFLTALPQEYVSYAGLALLALVLFVAVVFALRKQ